MSRPALLPVECRMPSGSGFRFGPFRLDPRGRFLLRDETAIPLQPRLFNLLEALVSRPGELLAKDELIAIGWPHHAVSDNSLAQAISRLRATLDPSDPERYIATVPRLGYRFVISVARDEQGLSDAELDALMAPHLALLDGRTMLETLVTERVDAAVTLFARVVETAPDNALAHVGLANAYILRFHGTRSADAPDEHALRASVRHALEARRLAPALAEAWATYGFVVDATGDRRRAIGAVVEAIRLEPDHWAHHLRLAWCSWGEQRLRAARRTLQLRRGLAVAHWLIATVHVARNELDLAERELDPALEAMASAGPSGFSGAAIHWLKGLLCLARGADEEALTHFDRERELEPLHHLFSRECCAAAWYAAAALHERRGDPTAACSALQEALTRVPRHPMAHATLRVLRAGTAGGPSADTESDGGAMPVDDAMARALLLERSGRPDEAAGLVASALASAPGGGAGWLLPIDPSLNVQRDPARWRTALTTLHERTTTWG